MHNPCQHASAKVVKLASAADPIQTLWCRDCGAIKIYSVRYIDAARWKSPRIARHPGEYTIWCELCDVTFADRDLCVCTDD